MPNCYQCGEPLCGAMRYCSRCGSKQERVEESAGTAAPSDGDHVQQYQKFYKEYVLKEDGSEVEGETVKIDDGDDELSIYQKMIAKYKQEEAKKG